ncbi:MAG: glucose-6-phosphate isomerase [Leptospiraceae bacterium]|nr:glucose-6-phosphate isomerase [Leptospiraceae bacterium]
MDISFDFTYAQSLGADKLLGEAQAARSMLLNRSGAGSDFLGWLELPSQTSDSDLNAIQAAADTLRQAELLVSIGIGGSYLGARAAISALSNPFGSGFPVLFAGHQMDARYHAELLEYLSGRDFAINVISKSGTTTEPGLAFRMLWDLIPPERRRDRVIATTDHKKGALRQLADTEGLRSFIIPDDVGGRFSVLSPVGLLPIAAAGLDIKALLQGAREMQSRLYADDSFQNTAIQYACYRNAAYRQGHKIEIMAAYQQSLFYTAEWWKQLYGESEGKGGKGIFPAAVNLSTDLHSMGQWIQDGERTIFETVLDIKEADGPTIPRLAQDTDQLNYLAGRSMHSVNRTALQATLKAHHSGGVPGLRIELDRLDAEHLGALFYLFEFGCGISAYMLGVNPFDQPGVEAYKKNMFAMLGKPGHS